MTHEHVPNARRQPQEFVNGHASTEAGLAALLAAGGPCLAIGKRRLAGAERPDETLRQHRDNGRCHQIGRQPISTSRATVLGASLVCSVESTR
jgi:hypothetical protein